MKVINPATEEILADLKEDTKVSLENKFRLLKSSQVQWENHPLGERIAIIKKFSSLLVENIEKLAAVLTSEVGKPLQQSRNEVNGARTRIEWLTANAEKYLSDEVMREEENLIEKISYEALGVVCNI